MLTTVVNSFVEPLRGPLLSFLQVGYRKGDWGLGVGDWMKINMEKPTPDP